MEQRKNGNLSLQLSLTTNIQKVKVTIVWSTTKESHVALGYFLLQRKG